MLACKHMELRPPDIAYLIVHHTATGRDATDFDGVKRYHVEGRGWDDIGYHYFIAADGEVRAGRPENVVGAHCKADDMNRKSLGVCLAGHFDLEAPTIAQLTAVALLLRRLMAKYGIPAEHVLGHGEVSGAATSCPGMVMRQWVAIFRKEAAMQAVRAESATAH
jgi:N-acetylmuramoyl-L-alanine amidase